MIYIHVENEFTLTRVSLCASCENDLNYRPISVKKFIFTRISANDLHLHECVHYIHLQMATLAYRPS
jgi:hypothetical protein